jgi:hypothetical protein
MKDLKQEKAKAKVPIPDPEGIEGPTITRPTVRTVRKPSVTHAPRTANLADIPRTDHAAFRAWWLGAHARRCCLEVLNRYGSEGFGLELELCEVAEEVMAAADVHRDAFESTRERLAGRMWSLINSLEPPDGLLSGPELAAAGVEVFDYVPA